MTLSIEEVLAKEDLPLIEVQIPQWGGSVWVRTMRADERSVMEDEHTASRNGDAVKSGMFRKRLLGRTLANEDGSDWLSPQQLDQLMTKNAAAVELIVEAALNQNGFGRKDVEELEKN